MNPLRILLAEGEYTSSRFSGPCTPVEWKGIAKKDIPMPVYQESAHFKELTCYRIIKVALEDYSVSLSPKIALMLNSFFWGFMCPAPSLI
jgi:hypothetical protein